MIELSQTDLKLGFGSIQMFSYNPALDDPLGEICVTLRYNPGNSKLTITVIECKQLKALDWGGFSDPYVKVLVSSKDKILLKEKTKVIKKTTSPYFNSTFSVKVSPSKIQTLDTKIIVKDQDIFGPNEVIGGVRLGIQPDSAVAEAHWDDMIQNPRKPQTQWHCLLPVE